MDDWVAKRGLSIVDKARLRELCRRSDLRGGLQVASHLGAIAISGVCLALAQSLWLAVPVFFAHGILINCLYAGQHELSHWTVFKRKSLNDLFGRIFGFVTFNPFLADRWAHFTHHRFTQDPEKDPELIGMKPYTILTYALDLIALNFWYRRFKSIVECAWGQLSDAYWLSEDQRLAVIAEARWTLGGYALIGIASVALGSLAAVEFWLAPMLLTKWFHQLQNTGEHVGLTHEPDTFKNTRTLIGSPIMRWLMWNMSYHSAHHSFPGVPFYALPALHAEILKRLDQPMPTATYLGAQLEIFRSLRRRFSTEPVR